MSALIAPPMPMPVPPPGPPARLTIEEFVARYAGTKAELVDGVVKEPHIVWPRQGKICATLAGGIGNWVAEHDLGHVMGNDSWFRTGPASMRGGDVSYYSFERLPRGPVPDGDLGCVPDLVAEVKSPSDRWGEIFAKVGEYLEAGVRAVIVVDPETATASVYRQGALQQIFQGGDSLAVPEVLPGFAVPVAALFA